MKFAIYDMYDNGIQFTRESNFITEIYLFSIQYQHRRNSSFINIVTSVSNSYLFNIKMINAKQF